MLRWILLTALSVLLINGLSSCESGGITSGDGGLRYESEGDVDIMTNFSAVVNTAKVYVDNARLWEDIVGAVMADALEGRTNGNPNKFSDIQINNLHLSYIRFRSSWDIDRIKNFLVDAELRLEYFEGNQYTGIKLSDFVRVNTVDKEVTFDLDFRDITDFTRTNRPDKMYFYFEFNDNPGAALEITYELIFDWQYSYMDEEDKG